MSGRWQPRVIDRGDPPPQYFDNRGLAIMAIANAGIMKRSERDVLLYLAWCHDKAEQPVGDASLIDASLKLSTSAFFEAVRGLIEKGFLSAFTMDAGVMPEYPKIRWVYGPRIDAVRRGR